MILENKSKNPNPFEQSPVELNTEVTLTRNEVKYENFSERFMCKKRDFKRQFAHLYTVRLDSLKKRILQACATKWGADVPVRKLSELSEEANERCIVIGTVFKHQELKPSILKEISEEQKITPQPVLSSYMSENDKLILEDEIQRIRLIGNINVKKLITGVVAAILGFENEEGKFEVEDICFPGVNSSLEKPLSLPDDRYVILISGLNLKASQNLLALELFSDWVKGEFGSPSDQENASKICRILIVGNSVSSSNLNKNVSVINTDIGEEMDILNAVKQLDETLTDLAKTVEVDIMPGECDPSNHVIPQQPFYNCIFPNAIKYRSFQTVTNPYECSIGGIRLLGSSGQPIENVKAFSDFEDPLDILENTLIWGHMAPSAPDTLGCYPYYSEDPFIITNQPHIYFVGNQHDYKSKTVNINGHVTTLLSIPEFYGTQTCVLLNLRTLDLTPVRFRV